MTRSEFEQMAPRLRAEMLKVSLAFLGNEEDAEDTVQEAMMLLWRYCGNIDTGRNVGGLAIRVAKNCCINRFRRKSDRHDGLDDCLLFFPDPSGTPQEHLEEKEAQRMMHEAIARLKPRERQLFELRQIEGLSTEEVSTRTGILRNSVSVMVSAARKKVYDELLKRLGK
ncbi:MAG: sigma-70 family RNA polymerase sigma factor [Prevotella sp.]|nr:sigma-70 family RNA polymerase sigma factor [Prevotella sp.]MBP5507915.1 sigma-70 family RNA polymerase sigma factor [Prevotella sp.]